MRSKQRIIYLCLILSILVLPACSNPTAQSEKPLIESKSANPDYQGNVKPAVERKVKITNEQQKQFDSILQQTQLQKQNTGGEKGGSKPQV